MRTPTWETSAGALAALLNTKTALQMADLVTITLSSGTVLRYTSWGAPLRVNGVDYLSAGATPPAPSIKRGRVRSSTGVSVDTMELTLVCTSEATINGVPMAAAARDGLFARAVVTLERVFSDIGAFTPVGTLLLFGGRIAGVRPTRSGIETEVVAFTELLDVMVPADVYQPGCRNNLYDLNCGVSRAAHTITASATVGTNASRTQFTANLSTAIDPAAIPQRFQLGTIECTSGPNVGIRRTVKTLALVSGTTFNLTTVQAWPFAVSAGNAFSLSAGCPRTRDACQGVFNNLARFRGEPFIPAPETVT